jgi:hypothetical protein
MRVPKRAARTARSRAGRRPKKARSAQNALKHGMRVQKYVLLPDEDGAEFAALEAAMVEELAPVGALQTVLARPPPGVWRTRIGWPPERGWGPVAGRKGVGAPFPNQSGDAQPSGQKAELFEERRLAQG